MFPHVSVIILNWNGWKDTVECLESLYQIDYPNYDVILVDNNSEDESLEKIRNYCSGSLRIESKFFDYESGNKPIELVEYDENQLKNQSNFSGTDFSTPNKKKLILIKNNENYGFAKGNNIGINLALSVLDPDYIMLLNNDTVVKENFLMELVNAAESNPEIGMAGSKILKYNNPQIIDSTGHLLKMGRIVDRGHEEPDEGQYDDPEYIIGAIAAACLYKKEMLQGIGLFDETFFTVYEDAELSWRSHKNGWKTIYVPTSLVYHKRGKSIKKKSVNARMIMLQSENMLTTAKRYGTFKDKFQYSFIILADGGYYLKERLAGRNNINVSQLIIQVVKSYLSIIYDMVKGILKSG
ncbi:MAG: putative glycosyltransferase [Methanobacterium sp. Maddingley MBC34]|nr:MAG: putative glycosyltransferase [Methanobacterium sp. Maddingley MBC34]